MSATLACLTGGSVYRMALEGQSAVKEIPPRSTPFGASETMALVEDAPAPFYLVPRCGPERSFLTPARVNYRANLYALKDLGVEAVVSWTAAAAITHNLSIGQLVIPDDLIDMTRHRPTTFFENSGLGLLRQFPVFCPRLRRALADALDEAHLPFQPEGTVAVTEGPRLETPSEVRLLANAGAELITHTLAPDFALAKELQMCFAGVCHVASYAETGSQHRPFSTGNLFSGLTQASEAQRVQRAARAPLGVARALLERLPSMEAVCGCSQSLAHRIEAEGLDEDWRTWFDAPGGPT
jgi:5'-methylthioadenosine phosphorylase